MTVITSPVSVTKIRQVLSETSNDVATLCSSSKINMWAKYKPVQVATPKALTEEQRHQVSYGIAVQTVSLAYPNGANNAAIFDNAENGSFGWSYSGPVGGVQSPYRLGDFKGYNHACSSPFYLRAAETGELKAQVVVGSSKASELPDGNITPDIVRIIAGLESPQAAGYGLLYRKDGTTTIMDAVNDAGEPKYPLVDANGDLAHYNIDISSDYGTYKVAAYIVNTQQSLCYMVPVPVVTCIVKATQKISRISMRALGSGKLIFQIYIFGNPDYLETNTIPKGTTGNIYIYKNKGDAAPEIVQPFELNIELNSQYDSTYLEIGTDAYMNDYHYVTVTFLDCTYSTSW